MIRIWIMIGMSLMLNTVFAEACLLESTKGNYPNMSCMQNAGVEVSIFNNYCEGANDETNTLTTIPNCPGKSIATCVIKLNGIDGMLVQHVYTASLVQAYKLSCENNMAGTGVWKFN